MLSFTTQSNGKGQEKLTKNIDTTYVKDVESFGYIVHHKSYINASNVWNTEITLNFDNLELLCLDCHNKEHFGSDDFSIDGELIPQTETAFELCGVYKKN